MGGEPGGDVARGDAARRSSRPGDAVALAGGAVVVLALAGLLWIVLPAQVLDPIEVLETSRLALAIAIAVLILDAVAPVPSSAVMIALGATAGLGPAIAASTIGLTGAAFAGYALGRWGSRALPTWFVDHGAWLVESTRQRAVLAVILTRPIPVAAETTALAAGARRLPVAVFVPAAGLGATAPAVAYSLIGHGFTAGPTGLVVALSTVVVVALAWPLSRAVLRLAS